MATGKTVDYAGLDFIVSYSILVYNKLVLYDVAFSRKSPLYINRIEMLKHELCCIYEADGFLYDFDYGQSRFCIKLSSNPLRLAKPVEENLKLFLLF